MEKILNEEKQELKKQNVEKQKEVNVKKLKELNVEKQVLKEEKVEK